MVDSDTYIKSNAPHVVNNCICFYLWTGATFKNTLQVEKEYLREYAPYVDAQKFIEAVAAILADMTTLKGLLGYIETRRKSIVSPYYSTFKQYIRHEWETTKTASQIVEIIKEQLAA